jgi:hypothetical protein
MLPVHMVKAQRLREKEPEELQTVLKHTVSKINMTNKGASGLSGVQTDI